MNLACCSARVPASSCLSLGILSNYNPVRTDPRRTPPLQTAAQTNDRKRGTKEQNGGMRGLCVRSSVSPRPTPCRQDTCPPCPSSKPLTLLKCRSLIILHLFSSSCRRRTGRAWHTPLSGQPTRLWSDFCEPRLHASLWVGVSQRRGEWASETLSR